MSTTPYTLSCESDFVVAGMQEGEAFVLPLRIASTLIAVSVSSAWCSWTKIKRLRLFFAHWLRYAVCVRVCVCLLGGIGGCADGSIYKKTEQKCVAGLRSV